MAKIVVNGTQMKCSSGTNPAEMHVSSQTIHKVSGQLIATEKDKKPSENIPSFGNCKSQPKEPPCVPSISSWSNVSAITSVNGLKVLLQSSECTCSKGGKITFLNPDDHVNSK